MVEEEKVVKNGDIDEDVKEEIAKKQVQLGISDEKEMRRTELNFYCELLSQFKKFNEELTNLSHTINIVSAKKIADYFTKLEENCEKEQRRNIVRKKISKSHLKSTKKAK